MDCFVTAIDSTAAYVAGSDAGTGANWTNPFADDDEDNPFCTPNSSDANDPFACKQIMCIQQRLLDTKDASDF